MKLGATIVVFLAAASLAAAAPRADDAGAVRSLIVRENAAFNAGSWRALWNMYTPSFHRMCNYARWVAAAKRLRAQVSRTSTTGIRVRVVNPERAIASYVLRVGTQVIAQPRNDLYVKLGGRWLAEVTLAGGTVLNQALVAAGHAKPWDGQGQKPI